MNGAISAFFRPVPVHWDHVRRLHNTEFRFESLNRNIGEILRILKHIPAISGLKEITKDVKEIPAIKKILTGGNVIFFENIFYLITIRISKFRNQVKHCIAVKLILKL